MAKSFLVNAGALSASRLFLAMSQVLVLPIIARFLDPLEFGDMALAMSVVVFVQILSDAGMGRSLIRQPKYDPAEWNSVFWMLACVGLTLTVVVLILAPIWANLFERPRLFWLLSALSILPLLSSLSAVPIARMEKDGHFPRLAVIRTLAGITGLVALLGMALAGAGVWALVAQQIAIAVTQTAASLSRSRFRPGLPRNFTPLGSHIRFASDNVGVSLIFVSQRQAPVLLIGSFLGAGFLGQFAMAQRFLNLPRNALAGPVSQAVFVRMAKAQHDRQKVADIYAASCLLLSVAVFPPLAVLAGSAQSIFPLLLSETWGPAATVFALAATGIMIEVATSCLGVMFQALDQTRLRLRMIAERTVLRTLVIAASVPFGLEAVAIAISVFSIAYLPRNIAFAQRAAPVSQLTVLRAMATSAVVSAIAAAALFACGQEFTEWQMLGLTSAAFPLAWAAAILPQIASIRRTLSTLNG